LCGHEIPQKTGVKRIPSTTQIWKMPLPNETINRHGGARWLMKRLTTTEHETTIEDINLYSRLAVAGGR
jgi:hypothetical protein